MTDPTEPTTARQRTAVLAIVIASYLMIVLDISIVITGLPKIHDGLHFSDSGLSWVQNAYMLSFGGLLLLGARAGDLLGRRRMFQWGLAIFTAASLGIGLAQTPVALLAARAVQGVGAAILAPSTLALLSTTFPEGPARTRAMAYYAAVAGVGASLGLVMGGLFADWLSWRAGFFMNVPIGLALMVTAGRYLVETPRRTGTFDGMGGLTSTLGMAAVVYGIVSAAATGWGDVQTVAPLLAGVALLAAFVVNEARVQQPILPLRLFASAARNRAYVARLLFLGGMVGFWFFTTQYLQRILGYTPFAAGMAFLPTTLPNFAAALTVPYFSRRFGSERLLAGALALAVIGMTWLAQVTADTGYIAGVALPMVLIGLGQGWALAPLTVAGVAGVSADDAGAASGMVNVAHQLGGTLGLGVLVVVFSATTPGAGPGRDALAQRIATALSGGGVMLALALIVVLVPIIARRVTLRAPGAAMPR